MRCVSSWSLLGLGILLAWPTTGPAADAGRTYDLRSRRTPGQIDRVEATLEAGGNLVVAVGDKEEKPKISVAAKLQYDEKLLAPAGGAPTRSIRYYDVAEAAIKGTEAGVKATLRPDRRLIGAATDGREVTLFSPRGPLTRDELELVDVLGTSLLIDRLLPEKPVALGATWSHDKDSMAGVFDLDEVTQTDVTSKLVSVKGNSAIVEMSGQVKGSKGGGSTALSMKAKYRFDLRTRRINWFGLAVHEKRAEGLALHGLDLVARLQMQIRPKAQSEQLSDAALKGLPLEPTPELTVLAYRSRKGGWQFVYDRRWFALDDHESDQAVLRMVEGDQAVANCSVSSVIETAESRDLTREKFQEDIKRGLKDNFGQFLSAGQWAGEKTNYRIYRVVVQGTIKADLQDDKPSELPIQWHYYRVCDEQGRQAVLAFTVEEPMVKQLGNTDKEIVESLRFIAAGSGQQAADSK